MKEFKNGFLVEIDAFGDVPGIPPVQRVDRNPSALKCSLYALVVGFLCGAALILIIDKVLP